MRDVQELKAELAMILGEAGSKKSPGLLRFPRRPTASYRLAPAVGHLASLMAVIDEAAGHLGLSHAALGGYLWQTFGTDDLAQLSRNDLRRVLRHLELQAEDLDEGRALRPCVDSGECPLCRATQN